MLLYLVLKNHAFVDGNKRIAADCFLFFLERNGLLYANHGQPIISNEPLASLTLFVAASKAETEDSEDQIPLEPSYTCLQEKSTFQRSIGTALPARMNREPRFLYHLLFYR